MHKKIEITEEALKAAVSAYQNSGRCDAECDELDRLMVEEVIRVFLDYSSSQDQH